MKTINAQQLAFLLEIKKQDARAKMCVAWSKHIGELNKAWYDKEGKLIDFYPDFMPIDVLSKSINCDLDMAINDIQDNYLKRPATRKYILCDFPEKKIKEFEREGLKRFLHIPPALKSLLPQSTIDQIIKYWSERYPDYTISKVFA